MTFTVNSAYHSLPCWFFFLHSYAQMNTTVSDKAQILTCKYLIRYTDHKMICTSTGNVLIEA